MVLESVLGTDGAGKSQTPIIDVLGNIFGSKVSTIITIIAIISIFNTIMMSNLSGSRTLYVMGSNNDISFLSYVNKFTRTPMGAIMATLAISIFLLLLVGNIEHLAIFSNLFVMLTMIVINGVALKNSKSTYQSVRNILSIVLGGAFIYFGGREMINSL
jgi:amino acid transporter